jgi:hypothetical protein
MASTESWYAATEPGVIEVKEIPAAKLMVAGSASDADDSMFGRLFRYISTHDVKMTVPVEAPLGRNEMRFYVGSRDASRALQSSAGARGGYSGGNIHATAQKLNDWLTSNPRYRPAGEAYAVFWNGPYVPGIVKRFEVHQPVKMQAMH